MKSLERSKEKMLINEIAVRAGLNLPSVRHREAAAAVQRIVESNGLPGMTDLLQRLGRDSRLAEQVVTELTVRETYFFRDPLQFDTLKRAVLPALLSSRPAEAPIRIWSAGCSTGEEPYSIAILMEEEGLGERAEILATDVCKSALADAEKAEFSDWSMRGVSPGFVAKYFRLQDGRLRLDPHIKKRVSFSWHNLGSEFLPSAPGGIARFDVVFCRNVLVYYGEEEVAHIAKRLFGCLADGGWLIVGPSDPPLWEHAPFVTETTSAGIVYRKERRLSRETMKAQRLAVDANLEHPSLENPVAEDSPLLAQTERAHELEFNLSPSMRKRSSDGGPEKEIASAEETALAYPLSPEMHYLHGKWAMGAGLQDEAAAAFRRALYLDRNLGAAHFMLGMTLRHLDAPQAIRAFANAAEICGRHAALAPVTLWAEMKSGTLAALARQRICELTKQQDTDI